MTCNPLPLPLPLSPRSGFLAHKYLLVAMVECLQAQRLQRPAGLPAQRDPTAVHRWMRVPSAERERTPCVLMREHHDRGDLSVAQVALECMRLDTGSLADWMRRRLPASSEPDQDTLHLALAPTLPGVPIVVHTVACDGESFTHLFSEGVWSLCKTDQYLFRAIRYAQLVATAIPLSSERVCATGSRPQEPVALSDDDGATCDLTTLGQAFDHIGVHAAIAELREFRRNQGHPCAALAASGASGG